jgi:radical SAM/Cys-rich protein
MPTGLPVIQPAAAFALTIDFDEKLAAHGLELHASSVDTLQINLGKLCNQACKHCHVDAGPSRTEMMSRETTDQVLAAIQRFKIPTVDITGGAPELNASFRHLVRKSRDLECHVIVRHNLTVMFEAGQEDLPQFFHEHEVEVISSLPYFLEQQTDAQRGRGVFENSIEAVHRLNAAGYGVENSGLVLNLIYNPVGAFLPPAQESIEADFKRELMDRHGISFNHLFTITNMPIKRFLDYLRRSGNEERYRWKLVEAFNPATVAGLMCRNLVSVDWTGRLYDCDFNQMLDLGVAAEMPQTIAAFDPEKLARRRIKTGSHCFGCTAGTGSSCGGAVTTSVSPST